MSQRVCMLVRSNLASDARVRKEASTLAAAGYEVDVIGLGAVEETIEASPHLRLHTLVHEPGYPRLSKARRLLAAAIAEPRLLRNMARVANALRPDIVHAHDLDVFPAAARVAARAHAALVFDSHELYAEMISWDILRPFLRAYERHAIRTADLVITASEERAEEYVARYGARVTPTAILNVPPLAARRREPLQAAADARAATGARLLLIYQGAAGGSRGLEAVVQGMSHLQEDIHLVLQGSGLEMSLGTLVADSDLRDRVHFWPPVPAEDVIGWAASADIGVVSYLPVNRNNILCAPNKLYDYTAAEIPVVCADLPPLRTAILGHSIGELFAPGDPQSFARAVCRLSEPVRLSQAGTSASVLARCVDWESQETKLLDSYGRLERS